MFDINGRIDCSFKPQTPSKIKEQRGAVAAGVTCMVHVQSEGGVLLRNVGRDA
jgi:hypothetical protein